jgi:hypothetical protein
MVRIEYWCSKKMAIGAAGMSIIIAADLFAEGTAYKYWLIG